MTRNFEWSDSLLKVTPRTTSIVNSNIHYDLSTFLSVVLKSRINIFATMWNAIASFSEGGTANIRQWLLNAETSFAFKRTSRLFVENPSWAAYKALISEVLILGSPAVRGHPNIVNLVAVSWEVVEGGDVRPVLVFEKAQRQDMDVFLKSEEGCEISFDARMSLCKEIAQGLMPLHGSNVVHGDLKPENVLVFTNASGYTAKVTDFGYSCFGASEDDVVYLPFSSRWAAPEYNGAGLAFKDAKKSDFYSYGLLCWYILFQKYFNDPDTVSPNGPEDEGSKHSTQQNAESPQDYLKKKLDKTIDETFPGGTELQKSILLEFFQSTLSIAASRCSDFTILIAYLDKFKSSADSDSPLELTEVPKLDVSVLEHASFSVAELVFPLSNMDYRVRVKTKKAIEARYSGSCKTCLSKAALQLAVCYTLGFGGPADKDQAAQLLKHNGYDIGANDREITLVQNQKHYSYKFEGKTLMNWFANVGTSPTYHLCEQYCKDGFMKEIKEIYEREIADMKAVLGIAHPVVHNLEWELCVTLQADGDFRAAERILKDLSKTEQEFGLDSTITEIGLAMTYWHQDKLDEAEMLLAEDLQRHIKQDGITFSGLVVMSCLASTYLKQHRFEVAEEYFNRVVSMYEGRLGKEHPDTIKVMSNLAVTYIEQDYLEEAEELLVEVIDISTRVLGEEHPDTLSSKNRLALTHRKQKNVNEAKDILVDLQATTARVLGEDHPDTLRCMDNLAMTYRDSKELKDAEKLESKVRDRKMEVFGKGHPDTLNSIYNLALIYKDQKRLGDAEKLLLEVVAADFSTHGLEHRDTVLSMDALGMIYLDQKRWEDAEKWCKRSIDANLKTSDSEDPYVLYLKTNLGFALTNQQRWHDAVVVYEQVFRAKKSMLCLEDLAMITVMSNLAWAYTNLRRWKEAEKLMVEVVKGQKRLRGPDHPATLGSMARLAHLYAYQGRKEEAEALKAEEDKLAFWARQDPKYAARERRLSYQKV
ncbi:hypothetical protein BDD12DRAFT_887761 [Trichophaea hybrida]|nr:hypothetical protein BDD12DRAFT_887761 [Trichophaea hybrida]